METEESKPALTATHIYYRPGRYFPKVTVRDALGQVAQASTEIVIIPRNKAEIVNENKMLRGKIGATSDKKTIEELLRRSEVLAEIAPNDLKKLAVKQYIETAEVTRKHINDLETAIQKTSVGVSVSPKELKIQVERAKKYK